MTTRYAEAIRQSLGSESDSRLDLFSVFAEVDSTNKYLLDQPGPMPGRMHIALAEYQTAGRGRRGKVWRAPPSSSICMSVAYTFERLPRRLPSLSLAIGVAVIEVLRGLGVKFTALKWPNDVLVGDAKLGGILVEARDVAADTPTTVTGLGLNVDLSSVDDADIAPDRPITDLLRCMDQLPERSVFVALLIDSTLAALREFDERGFAAFVERWKRCDWLRGRQTTVETVTEHLTGAAEGVDDDGALLLMTAQGRRIVHSGSIVLPDAAGNEQ
jgi:BirA family biotin operon repressor/biotin-[acetyl-CoA-carboxylase] ligase